MSSAAGLPGSVLLLLYASSPTARAAGSAQARSQVVCWGGAKHVISGLNQWCSQDNTCSNARTACMCVVLSIK